MNFKLIRGNIIKSGAEAIVNAANTYLHAGGGVCGAIFDSAGYNELSMECNKIGGCKTGDAVITSGYKLSKYIIHAVGPIYTSDKCKDDLYNAYFNSLLLANKYDIRSIAFPSISTGIYGYPLVKAAPIALSAIYDFIDQYKDSKIENIYLYAYDDKTYEVFNKFIR